MNYASDDLINEHEGILWALNILEKITDDISNKKSINIADINDIISFFKLFSDKCHHGKEENIYFPALEKNRIQNGNGPIGQMLIAAMLYNWFHKL